MTEGYGVPFGDAVEIVANAECDFLEALLDGRAHPERVEATLGPALDNADGVELVVHLPFTVPAWPPFDTQRHGAVETHNGGTDSVQIGHS